MIKKKERGKESKREDREEIERRSIGWDVDGQKEKVKMVVNIFGTNKPTMAKDGTVSVMMLEINVSNNHRSHL